MTMPLIYPEDLEESTISHAEFNELHTELRLEFQDFPAVTIKVTADYIGAYMELHADPAPPKRKAPATVSPIYRIACWQADPMDPTRTLYILRGNLSNSYYRVSPSRAQRTAQRLEALGFVPEGPGGAHWALGWNYILPEEDTTNDG